MPKFRCEVYESSGICWRKKRVTTFQRFTTASSRQAIHEGHNSVDVSTASRGLRLWPLAIDLEASKTRAGMLCAESTVPKDSRPVPPPPTPKCMGEEKNRDRQCLACNNNCSGLFCCPRHSSTNSRRNGNTTAQRYTARSKHVYLGRRAAYRVSKNGTESFLQHKVANVAPFFPKKSKGHSSCTL